MGSQGQRERRRLRLVIIYAIYLRGTSFFTGPVSRASPKTERRQKLFLSKLEYFNSSGAPDRNVRQSSRLSNNSRVAVNNSIIRAKQSQYNPKEEEINRTRPVTKSIHKFSPGLSPAPGKTDDSQHRDPGGTAGVKKPLFVTKYSPYRGDTAKQSAPLIMTAGTYLARDVENKSVL